MIPWIQVYSNLPTNPKTYALASALGLKSADAAPNVVAVGLLVSLWSWAIQNAPDGIVADVPDEALCEAAHYRKNASKFVESLRTSGWLDDDGQLVDWSDYASEIFKADEKRRAKNRERVERYRERRNGTVTLQTDDKETEININKHKETFLNNISTRNFPTAEDIERHRRLLEELRNQN